MEIHFSELIHHYGPGALFVLLAFGIIGLPVPDETLLIFSGALVAKGHIQLVPTFLAIYFGSIIGISISFFLGRYLGYNVLNNFGPYIGINNKKLELTHQWFESYGKYLIFIGYFIPGIRHITGIFAGIARLEYWIFALFAYTGALCWSTLFFSIGYFGFHSYHHANF